MYIKKYCITLILLLFGLCATYSQERRTEICVDFRVNSTVIDSAYSDNAVRMQEIIEFLRNIRQDSTINIVEVSFCCAASPEGSDQLNRKLARGRLTALENLVRQQVDIPDSIITHNDNYIPWEFLKSKIEDSELVYNRLLNDRQLFFVGYKHGTRISHTLEEKLVHLLPNLTIIQCPQFHDAIINV